MREMLATLRDGARCLLNAMCCPGLNVCLAARSQPRVVELGGDPTPPNWATTACSNPSPRRLLSRLWSTTFAHV
eukprot:scaffold29934_cov103-Isochrysis_galbana.AAC.6